MCEFGFKYLIAINQQKLDMEQLTKEFGELEIKKAESTSSSPAHKIQPKKVGILSDKRMLEHCSTKSHPQCPDRIVRIMENFKQKGLLDNPLITNVESIAPIDLSLVTQVHGQGYTEFVSEMWPQDETKRKQIYINVDTYFNKSTIEAAKIAANAGIRCVDRVCSGEWRSAFAVIRPPGHHSGMKGQPHGFCFFNNVGIAANYALKKFQTKRILILDWDAHHGEGTQTLFYNSKEVMYASIHRFDEAMFFPHVKESSPEFIGKQAAKGYNINVAWNIETKQSKAKKIKIKETCGDKDYIYIFQRILLPIFKQFNPELIFISAGFDSACGDPLAGLELTKIGFTYMTQQLMQVNPRIIAMLEGGYNLDSISWGSESVLRAILGTQTKQDKEGLEQLLKNYVPNRICLNSARETLKHISQYWPILMKKQLIELEASKTKLRQDMEANKNQTQSLISEKEVSKKNSSPTQSDIKSNTSEMKKLAAEMEGLELKSNSSVYSTASEPVKASERQLDSKISTTTLKGDMKKKPQKVQEHQTKSVTQEYKGPITRAKAKLLKEQSQINENPKK